MMNTLWRLLCVCAALPLLIGCGSNKVTSCTSGVECTAGQGCHEQQCVALCNAVCPGGERCVVSNANNKQRCVTAATVSVVSGDDTTTPIDLVDSSAPVDQTTPSDSALSDQLQSETVTPDAGGDGVTDAASSDTVSSDVTTDNGSDTSDVTTDSGSDTSDVTTDSGSDTGDTTTTDATTINPISCPNELGHSDEWLVGNIVYPVAIQYAGIDAVDAVITGESKTETMDHALLDSNLNDGATSTLVIRGRFPTTPPGGTVAVTIDLRNASGQSLATRTCKFKAVSVLTPKIHCPGPGADTIDNSSTITVAIPFIGPTDTAACNYVFTAETADKDSEALMPPTVLKSLPPIYSPGRMILTLTQCKTDALVSVKVNLSCGTTQVDPPTGTKICNFVCTAP